MRIEASHSPFSANVLLEVIRQGRTVFRLMVKREQEAMVRAALAERFK